MLPPGPTS